MGAKVVAMRCGVGKEDGSRSAHACLVCETEIELEFGSVGIISFVAAI